MYNQRWRSTQGMNKKSAARARVRDIETSQALLLHDCISALMRQFRIEPGLLAGSVYANLHANDIGLFEILATEKVWTVRRIAQTLAAPMTTVSSALDRLERQGLVERRRIEQDRRVVRIEFTGRGRHLADRLRNAHIENCRVMLSKLNVDDRREFLRMAAQISAHVPASQPSR
jgi:DNA-binding MarR family transcriptional regulator